MTFDRTLEIICIILELCSQILKSAPITDNGSIKKSVDYCAPLPILRPNNADNIHIIEFVKGVIFRNISEASVACRPFL